MKKIVVKSCEGCPYYIRNYKYEVDLCDVSDRKIINIKDIPIWCTLQNESE